MSMLLLLLQRIHYILEFGLGTAGLGDATSRTFIKRRLDNRSSNDTLYRVRYVIPKDSEILQDLLLKDLFYKNQIHQLDQPMLRFKNILDLVILKMSNDLRNFRFISDATWAANLQQLQQNFHTI